MGTVIQWRRPSPSKDLIRVDAYRKEGGDVGLTKCYIRRKSDVTKGFPVYSQANVIRQAFKLLAARYGWGGMYNGRDCSGFTHDVFLSMGWIFRAIPNSRPWSGPNWDIPAFSR